MRVGKEEEEVVVKEKDENKKVQWQ
jgi:hypothetical protein